MNVRDEVLSGVVPNIGIRGLNPDRSEKLLILEDGVPAGLAPYSVNAAYYVPPIERMARVELLKGSGQILYGPLDYYPELLQLLDSDYELVHHFESPGYGMRIVRYLDGYPWAVRIYQKKELD